MPTPDDLVTKETEMRGRSAEGRQAELQEDRQHLGPVAGRSPNRPDPGFDDPRWNRVAGHAVSRNVMRSPETRSVSSFPLQGNNHR
jgi:hypothetical protein